MTLISINHQNSVVQSLNQVAACYRDNIYKLTSDYGNEKGYAHEHKAEGQ